MTTVRSLAELSDLYNEPVETVFKKETPALTPAYRLWIEKATFFAIASAGNNGIDCSPRGDKPGALLKVLNDKCLAVPDRRGNNRLDTLKNIINDPNVSLLFFIPGINETLRLKGKAHITTDPALIDQFDVDGIKPTTVIVIDIEAVYFQCARALKRSGLWNKDAQVGRSEVPTAGQMIQAATLDFDGKDYDSTLEERQKATLY